MKYLLLLISCLSLLHAQHLQFECDTMDWGVVTYNSNSQRTFYGTNISDKPILIYRVSAGDPHYAYRYTQTLIMPGEKFEIGITYPTTRLGTSYYRRFDIHYKLAYKDSSEEFSKPIWMICYVLPENELPCFGNLGIPYNLRAVEDGLEFRYREGHDTTVVLTIQLVNQGCAAAIIEDIWHYETHSYDDLEYKILTDYKNLVIQPDSTASLDIELKYQKDLPEKDGLFLMIKQAGAVNNISFFIHTHEVNWVRKF